jgi:hypothetical protein
MSEMEDVVLIEVIKRNKFYTIPAINYAKNDRKESVVNI